MNVCSSAISHIFKRDSAVPDSGAKMDPTNTIERFQSAGKALGEARYRNREEGFAIIVEGPRTKPHSYGLVLLAPSKWLTVAGGWIGLLPISTKLMEQEQTIDAQQ